MDWARYAIYWLPDGPLGRAGAEWLGWDARTGRGEGQHSPARYGFHATIKPPFRLAAGTEADGLVQAARDLAARLAPVALGHLRPARLGRFLALTPEHNPAGLAAAMVEGLDAFRAPPGAEDLARRRASGLSPAQDALLQRWGYPYVMEEFRMHLTLTGPDPAEGRLAEAEAVFGPHAGPHTLSALSLVGQNDQGRFHLIEDLPLGAHSGAA
ncbi:DUF1045 domain-containing protein [Jannaschia seohaensis]|uniref:Uncharacterized protein DUF1045 n=1 Tax=Jannaschia seohaensis TaxID=475081 RepID=A0A2Y9A6E2_9RHOB|nr:DUF1045 domain-containing protein [Jannaschia seohaensis]PWJ21891.1 uncharacterized protein DUF1045 [Jannaschia seohaensis]SSA38169.1 Protein of unknown function [Jannaschia seohaensis]